MKEGNLWSVFKQRFICDREGGFALDTSRMGYDKAYLERLEPKMQSAFEAMAQLERGALANPDERRMVGHYWLRDPEIAPNVEIREAIISTRERIRAFAKDVRAGAIVAANGERFKRVLVVGIGGSALGPQFVSHALSSAADPMEISFFDNTDPDGMARTLYALKDLAATLVIIISKSGGTKETRNGQIIAKRAFEVAGLDWRKNFVAVTGAESELDKTALSEGWLARFPMWDWVGGRTSECSAVGLLPLALQGFDLDQLLGGAAEMDRMTRERDTARNPAALLALAWYHSGCGKGLKDMVVLPYKDRLELFSKYLQQLVMESLGKEHDLSGAVVNQGLAVYGNKGSTDQHAYVQQLRDGIHNFFVVFIEVLSDRSPRTVAAGAAQELRAEAIEVEPGITAGDYLHGFFLGTRAALFEKGRESVTVTVREVNERSVGMLIALFERAVGLYASLINVNAYHQPGVEAGKKAAAEVLTLQSRVVELLRNEGSAISAEQIAAKLNDHDEVERVFHILRHLSANNRLRVVPGATVFEDLYRVE